jgi:uncharacterized SAM-binding protein YcdF (DUF218 family)
MLGINEVGDSTYVEWGDPDRFFDVIALFKAHKAQKLVFTGGKIPSDKSKKTEEDVLKEYAILNGISSKKILVNNDVENTADEAVAVKELISPSKKIILVTSAYHTYRAKKLFEKQGFEVIPYKAAGNSTVTLMDLLPTTVNLGMTETGIIELSGRLFYLIRS